jgi:hypothetical protein
MTDYDVLNTEILEPSVLNHAVLSAAYRHFNARELQAVLDLMRPDVKWPNGMEGGWVHGHEGVREYWLRQWALISPNVEPLAFTEETDGRIAVKVHQRVLDLEGKVLADMLVDHVYRLEDGLIVSMEIHERPSS